MTLSVLKFVVLVKTQSHCCVDITQSRPVVKLNAQCCALLRCGAQMRTFLGLCGIGDLFLSATSATSRNYAGGMAIAQGQPPAGTVEGIFALRGLISRAQNLGVPTPVLIDMQKKMNLA